ncbi:uncharacterized protein LOC113492462 [Trichoplusia ni]|uniref:Uncharacterized protein LOC113492462 n=1 Tax=Trichoplusia ni TaxID=7111 RepID=A0A7E5VBP6_TRINI|nr:uncharacterized protein LOC113492462 [Trichoplusia ni]
MASFACYSVSKENTSEGYKELINRVRKQQLPQDQTDHTVRSASYAQYAAHKDLRTYVYKDFLYQLRKAEFITPCVIVCDNPAPFLKTYVRLIEAAQIQDGLVSNAYYGELKKVVTSFVNYFTHVIDEIVRRIDRYSYNVDNHRMMSLVDNTIDMATENQDLFLMEFTVTNEADQEKVNEIEQGHHDYVEALRKLRDSMIYMNKVETIENFAKEQFEISTKKINELCNFTHGYISVMLADRVYEISVSLEETVDRMNTNKRKYSEQCSQNLTRLIHNLYDKNKENLEVHRRDRSRSVDSAEINRSIEVIKSKIENFGNEETIARLELETSYWARRLKDFNDIARVLTHLQGDLENLGKEEEKYNELKCTDLPGPKTICFDAMGENFVKKRKYLEEKIAAVSKTLVTFFCVRGTDRILYADNVGSYYCDEFNHQNYVTSYGLRTFHVNCEGQFVEHCEGDPYFFDDNGRFKLIDGEKVHQCAPCTSQYKLDQDGLFNKITVDCGHSTKVNEKCRLDIKDLTDVEILPTREIIDITRTLDPDSVKYLWDSYGMILPEVLYDLCLAKPKNPIHYLAHILIKRRFESTNAELEAYRELANKYRSDIYQKRQEESMAATQAWKSKQVKRRKPEDLDDTNDWATFNQQTAQMDFINSLDFYN